MIDYVPAPLRGAFLLSVVGTSHYQDALDKICGGKAPDGHNVTEIALLTLQDNNIHDINAVEVKIRDMRVGYLSRVDAIQIRRKLYDMGVTAKQFQAVALIRGGWSNDQGDGNYGVRLDLDLYPQG